ncbi:MAG: hypothetical protein ABEN55_11360 [Bradymonadaceae bacterium]
MDHPLYWVLQIELNMIDLLDETFEAISAKTAQASSDGSSLEPRGRLVLESIKVLCDDLDIPTSAIAFQDAVDTYDMLSLSREVLPAATHGHIDMADVGPPLSQAATIAAKTIGSAQDEESAYDIFSSYFRDDPAESQASDMGASPDD